MLANPPPSVPAHHESHLNPDPFQSLYHSLANLTLAPPASTPNDEPSFNPLPDLANSRSTSPGLAPTPTPSLANSNAHPAIIPVTPVFPPGDNVIFAHSSFFRRRGHPATTWALPSPAEVRLQAAALGLAPRPSMSSSSLPSPSPSPSSSGGAAEEAATLVPFPRLGLLVRYGGESAVPPAEGKALLLVRRALSAGGRGGGDGGGDHDDVPVPEVFGWRRDCDAISGVVERFVYMSLPKATAASDGTAAGAGDGVVTLQARWAGMREEERTRVCGQLREVVAGGWRRLRQSGTVGFVGSVDNGPLTDHVFRGCTMATGARLGPFPSVAAFHSYFVSMAVAISGNGHAGGVGGQVRYTPHHIFPDDVPIVFTHGGLHPRNIIVSMGPNPRLVSILGWEQAGWYPAYWELCKARWECSRYGTVGDWESNYLPWILEVDEWRSEMGGWNAGPLCQYWDYFIGLMHRWQG